MAKRRYAMAAALAAAIAVAVPHAIAPAIAQAVAYRYWSYWLGSDGGWSFANVGPAFRVPADGTLEGWRYSVSGVEGNAAPSFAADFAAVCDDTPAEDGLKRVAVVVDPGDAGDAPEGEQPPGAWALCVVAAESATGYDILRAAASVRTDSGLVCAIGGYPARGCGDVVADPAPSPSASATPSPKPTRSPEPSRTPRPSSSSTEAAAATTTAAAPTTSSAPVTAAPTTGAPNASAAPTPTTTPTPTPSSAAPPTPSSAAPPPPLTPTPTPTPTYSLLTAPLADPPAGDSGSGGAIVAGIAVIGIAGLGGAAILRLRRSS